MHPVQDGTGPNTIVWEVETGYGKGMPGRSFHVTIDGILRGSQEVSHSWTVRLFGASLEGRASHRAGPRHLSQGSQPLAAA
jgi:hypothetical protein